MPNNAVTRKKLRVSSSVVFVIAVARIGIITQFLASPKEYILKIGQLNYIKVLGGLQGGWQWLNVTEYKFTYFLISMSKFVTKTLSSG